MSESASECVGVAKRYATATFDLSKDQKALDNLETDIVTINVLLSDSADFVVFLNSPLLKRKEQIGAMLEIAKTLGLSKALAGVLCLMAEKKRLSIVPYLVTELSKLVSEEKGEVTAEIISATKLTLEQNKKLVETLSSSTGKIVKLDSMTDKKIIGGLIVKVGSRMLDTSIRAKLISLQATMKEVG